MRCKACNKEIEINSKDELLELCNKCFNTVQFDEFMQDISTLPDNDLGDTDNGD